MKVVIPFLFLLIPALSATEGIQFFENKVRPIFEEHCNRCHGEEKQKGGFQVTELAESIELAASCENLSLGGLMTMGAGGASDQENQAVFRSLKELRDLYLETYPQLTELSMGMSGDFTLAILEGASYITIGSLILGARQY